MDRNYRLVEAHVENELAEIDKDFEYVKGRYEWAAIKLLTVIVRVLLLIARQQIKLKD